MKKRHARVKAALAVCAILPALGGFTLGYQIGAHNVEPEVVEVPVVEIIEVPVTMAAEPVKAQPVLHSLGEFRITHYCPCAKCCGEWADGITSTGTQATPGRTIAVDPDVIPLGSTVVIDGHKYIAEDIGELIKGNTIDIFMADHQAALEAGVKRANVYLLEE